DIQLLTVDEPAIELRDSDIEVVQDFRNASGVWRMSALQQREFLEPPTGAVPAGIEKPIERIREAYVEAQRDGGRGFLLLGEAGTGKSFVLRYALSLFSETGSASHTAVLAEN